MVEQWRDQHRETSRAFEVLPENQAAVELFVAVQTQWRVAGMGGLPVGLDYAGVEAAGRLLGTAMTPVLFDDLRLMEGAALRAMTEGRRR